ncbi:hypothetical protein HDK90DRAFT_514380 [Phyllosticta capitalensis]|uniref:Uncharacterized protein n=1 Tax=Phyllosticta capitalensis TaxID=121624 RepID=A0ABR1YCM7_9PEZI
MKWILPSVALLGLAAALPSAQEDSKKKEKGGGSSGGGETNIISAEKVKDFDYRVGLETLNGETRYVAWVGGQPVCNAKTTIGKGDTAWCTRDTLIQYQGQYIKVRFYNCEALNPHSQVSDEEKTCPKKEQDSDPTNGESDKCMRQKGGDKIQGVYLKLLDANGGEDSKYPDVLCGDLRETFQCGPALVVTRLQCSPPSRGGAKANGGQ